MKEFSTMPRQKSNPQIVLRPQDLGGAAAPGAGTRPGADLCGAGGRAGHDGVGVHGAVDRAVAAQLAHKDSGRQGDGDPGRACGCLFSTARATVFRPRPRQPDARRPTGYAAAPLKDLIVPGTDPVPVWPHKNGTVRGMAFYPLYPSVPEAAGRNPALWRVAGALRCGARRQRPRTGAGDRSAGKALAGMNANDPNVVLLEVVAERWVMICATKWSLSAVRWPGC
jgi:hypothetical protein